jgi:biotin carboxyl carrier protein
MKVIATVLDRSFEIEMKKENGNLSIMVDNEPIELNYETDCKGLLSAIIVAGKRYEVRCDDLTGNYRVSLWQKPYEVTFSGIETEQELKAISAAAQLHFPHRIIKAPMSGLVIAIHTTTGKDVKPGDSLLLLEAMKMQNEIRSPIAAKVLQIYAAVGKTVEKGEKILELEPVS